MSVTLQSPLTEPTTDFCSVVFLVGPTSDRACGGWSALDTGTPSRASEFEVERCTTDYLPLSVFRSARADEIPPRTENLRIDDLGEAGYRVLQPIPVEIRRVRIGDFEASFRAANIAMSGSDRSDAFQALIAEILETFDVLLSEQNLGPDAAEQRRLLHTYIARA